MARGDAIGSLKKLAEETRYFRADLPVVYRTAHGCLDVLGGLNSQAGGTMAQMALPVHVAVAVQEDEERRLRVRSGQCGEVVVRVGETASGWAAGVAAVWGQAGGKGASILIHSNIPAGAGQSSSTALLAAVALALAEPRQTPAPLAIAQRVAAVEAQLRTGSTGRIPTGPIIQALSCLGGAGRAAVLRYSAQPHRFVGAVPLPADVRMLALDTGVRRPAGMDWGWGGEGMEEFAVATAMGMRIIETIYRDLGQPHTPLHGYLANTSPLLYRQYFRTLLPRRMRAGDYVRTYGDLGWPVEEGRMYRVRTAVDHLIAEHEHAEQFLQALEELAEGGVEEGERQKILARAGRLLLASHHSYRLRLELSCREADWLVDRLMEAGPERGVYGARMTGQGGGGTVAALLARSGEATEILLETMKTYQRVMGMALGVVEA